MMKAILRAVVVLILLVAIGSCTKDVIDTTGDLVGIVSDSQTGEPLSGASVSLTPLGKTSSTGSDGRFEFNAIEAGLYKIQVNKDDYQSNTKEVTVMAAETTQADIQLKPLSPVLTVSPGSLDFGPSATTLTLNITNSGQSTLKWQISEDAQWLSCLPTSGNTTVTEQSSVVVSVDRTELSRGNYSQTIAITSNGGSAVVKVTMSVAGIAVSLSPEELDFGSITSSMQLTLTNTGTGTISYSLTPSNEWIVPDKTKGIFTYSEVVTVVVNRSVLSTGDYTGELSLKVGDQSVSVPVKMNIPSKTKPTVSFISIDNPTFNSAQLKGAVVSIGSAKVTRHGFCWSTEQEPTVDLPGICNLGDCIVPKDFTYNLTGLEANTAYYVRAYAENAEGVSYSNEMRLNTSGTPSKPTVETGSASDIRTEQAGFSGNIINLGNVPSLIQYGHVWSTSANPTIDLSTKTQLGKTQSTGAFNSTLTNLSANTTYHVRAYATNEIGTSYGDEVTFVTKLGDLSLTTAQVTSITHQAATSGGTITALGGNTVTERGVCWSTSSNPTISGYKAVSSDNGNTFACRMEGLSPKTVYYVRAYANTSGGTVYYGNNVTFTTTHEITLPALSTVTASEIGVSKVSLACSVTDNGDGKVSDCGFCYGLSANPTINDNKVSYGASNSAFGRTVTGLSENTLYHVRAYATNEAGTAYSSDMTFTTLEVTAPAVSGITFGTISNTSAAFTATVTSLGNGTLADAGFCYSTSSFPTVSDKKLSCGKATSLAKTAIGLIPETKYYVRAYAINEKGTTYGAENSFTTTKTEVNPYTTLTVETSYGSTTLDMAKVTGGTFDMGAQSTSSSSTNYDVNANADEKPVHKVTVSTFYMSKTPVTQYLWYVVTGGYPNISSTYGRGDTYPVYNITYDQCLAFINKLNSLTGKRFRMPTEAEWEFAARGGNNSEGTRWSGNTSCGSIGWFSGNSGAKTHPVAEKTPNELNIYDMSGNVWEWCSDWYANYSSASQTNPTGAASGSNRVIRGGSYSDTANDCRVSMRSFIASSNSMSTLGVRLVME